MGTGRLAVLVPGSMQPGRGQGCCDGGMALGLRAGTRGLGGLEAGREPVLVGQEPRAQLKVLSLGTGPRYWERPRLPV